MLNIILNVDSQLVNKLKLTLKKYNLRNIKHIIDF